MEFKVDYVTKKEKTEERINRNIMEFKVLVAIIARLFQVLCKHKKLI